MTTPAVGEGPCPPALLEYSALALMVLLPGIGQQYLRLPLLGRRLSPGYCSYTIAVLLLLLSTPDGLNLRFIRILWWPAWLAASVWAFEHYCYARERTAQRQTIGTAAESAIATARVAPGQSTCCRCSLIQAPPA